MAYIIENANLLKETQLQQISLLVKGENFSTLRPSFKRFSFMRVDAKPFIMTPPHVLFCPELPDHKTFQSMKDFFIESFISRGSTMFLTYAEVEKENLVKSAIKNRKKELLNSPIDFTIGVKVPASLITPSLLRSIKREQVPALFVEINADFPLEHIPWGWIREAMFPYKCHLIPIFTDIKQRLQKAAQVKWTSILTKEKIPHIPAELKENEPISHIHLSKIGIYPIKSSIRQGGEVSYNLYLKGAEMDSPSELDLFQNHQDQLSVTVHKGTVIRAGRETFFRPGFGEFVPIKTPQFFKLD